MKKVAISEFRAHMPKYLTQVKEGNTILLTSHGQEVAELKQPTNRKEAAQHQLAQIAKSAHIGDIVTPVIDDFSAAQ